MKHLIFFSLFSLFIISTASPQGIVRGKITDETGETIIGATVVEKTNHSIWSVADLDGNYSLKIPDSLEHTIVISFVSMKTIEETVHLKNNKVVVKNYVLSSSAKEMKEVQVTAKAVRAREYFVETMKKNSAVTLDYISSETMKKTGDVNVVAAVARVSGVSTNGGFITVRGIGDRYVKTAINGSRIPTLDPFTNNIKLDLFPASLVDNVIISKTASPDLPGDFAGAYLSVETKDYPENLSVNVETSVGYNNQSTFKDVITTQRSSTDWLGFDKSFRDHEHTGLASANVSPTQYQELVAIGLGDYYKSLGVTGWVDNSATGNTYFKLGLVQLGLLAPAQFNDDAAFAAAKNNYLTGTYQADAFNTINARVPATGKSFPSNWNTTTMKAPLDFSQSFSVGNQTKLFGKPLGFIFGYRYGSTIVYDENSDVKREKFDQSLSSNITQQVSRETNGWSALANVAYKLTNHSFSFLFMPNFTGVNNARSSADAADPLSVMFTKSQFYEQRKQLVYQFKSEHYLPSKKIKAELNASYTVGKSSAPDFKNLQYKRDTVPGGYQYLIGNGIGEEIHRFYRYLNDDVFDSRFALEFPIANKENFLRKIKSGVAYQRTDRRSDQYDYKVNTQSTNLSGGDIDAFLSLNNFDIVSYTNSYGEKRMLNLYYSDMSTPADHTFGESNIEAAFVMSDYSFTSKLRASGGLRVEKSHILTDVFKFDSLAIPADDARRNYHEGAPAANPGMLDDVSFLPSLNIIYKLNHFPNTDENRQADIRMNYSRTIARPSIRELSDVGAYDYEVRGYVYGNSDLQPVAINNYDIRFEKYFMPGENISASVFYKDFKNHIELIISDGYTWQNVPQSSAKGIELEGRKKLGKNFYISSNITLVDSKTEFVRTRQEVVGGIKNNIPMDTVTHTMFGQAPYVLNVILDYATDSSGFKAAISYNVQGPRLVISSAVKEIPDIFEMPRHLVDVKLSKSIAKHWTVALTLKDILNTPVVRSYKDWNTDYDRFTWGTRYLLGVSYKL